MKKEIWKDIKEYEGLYMISNLGRVKSLDRHVRYPNGTLRLFKGKILSTILSGSYPQVTLSKNSKVKGVKIHRLLGLTFIPNPQNKSDINHKNGIKHDNRLSNLEWTTRSENIRHAFATGLNDKRKKSNGSGVILNEEDVIGILKLISKDVSVKEIAKKYNVSRSCIHKLKRGDTWNYFTKIKKSK